MLHSWAETAAGSAERCSELFAEEGDFDGVTCSGIGDLDGA